MNNTTYNEILIALEECEAIDFNHNVLTPTDIELGEILLKHIDKFPNSPQREYEAVKCIMELCRN